MANEITNPITYMDWAKTRDPDGSTAQVVELLAQANPIVEDAVVREGNLTTGHRTTVRTGYGQSTWRKMYEGVQPTKSSHAQVDDTSGELLDYTEVDRSLANLENDREAFLRNETAGKWEEMSQTFANTLFFGDTAVNPERFLGFLPRYNDAGADNARNIVSGKIGNADTSPGEYTSIWLISWGLDTTFTFFPKGSMVGLHMEDLGEVTLHDAAGGRFPGYRILHQHNVGLCVRDWRYNVRIANIHTPTDGSSAQNLIDTMTIAVNRLQTRGKGRPVFYANREVVTTLDLQAQNKNNVQLNMMEWAGSEVPAFRGIPIRMCEALDTSDEDFVTGLPQSV